MFFLVQDNALDAAKLIDIYNSQGDVINTLWNFLIVIALGILGYIYKDKEMRNNSMVKLAFSIGYFFFALGNIVALGRAFEISISASTALRELALDENMSAIIKPVLLAHTHSTVWMMVTFHVFVDILVLAAIWLPSLVMSRRKKAAS